MNDRVSGNLGDILLREGLISAEQLEQARREAFASNRSIARVLVEMGVISEKVKLGILQKKLGCELVGLKQNAVDEELARRVPKTLAVRHAAIPVRRDLDGLVVAMDDPSDLEAVDKLTHLAGVRIKPVLANIDDITRLLETYPAEAAPEGESQTGLKVIRGITFWLLLLLPLVGFYLAVKFFTHFNVWLAKQNLSVFDVILYALLTWGGWSVIVFYIHDIVFSSLIHEEEMPAPESAE